MMSDNSPSHPASCEHLFDPERDAGNCLRLGLLAATTIHLAVVAVTWPTLVGPEPESTPQRTHDYVLLQPVHFKTSRPLIDIPKLTGRSVPARGPETEYPEPIVEREIEISPAEERPTTVPVLSEPPPPVTTVPEVVDAYVDVDPPRVLHRVEPRYTETARKIRVEGVVVLSLLIDTGGRVADVTVLRGLPFGLTENAVSAARQWQFEPCTFNGDPVNVRYTLTVRFRIAS